MHLLLIDNYDSFTFNLYHYLEQMADKVDVVRHDEAVCLEADAYDAIVLSPGPGLPDEAGLTKEVIKKYAGTKPILGICLGLQSIGEVFGCKLKNLPQVLHGKQRKSFLKSDNDPLFKNISNEFLTAHYHSWVIDPEQVSDAIEVLANDEGDHIMAIKHKEHSIYGVQFHPESVLTPDGFQILKNWTELIKK